MENQKNSSGRNRKDKRNTDNPVGNGDQGRASFKTGSTTQGGSNFGQGSSYLGGEVYHQGEAAGTGSNYENEAGRLSDLDKDVPGDPRRGDVNNPGKTQQTLKGQREDVDQEQNVEKSRRRNEESIDPKSTPDLH